MDEFEKNTPVEGDIAENGSEMLQESVVGDTEEESIPVTREIAPSRGALLREKLPIVAVYARYLIPLLTGVLLLVLSFFDLVYFFMEGEPYKMSLFAFFRNTLTSTHDYLGGTTKSETNWFYGLLSVGAVVGILLYVLALFLAVLAAVTACRAFTAGHESEKSNRMKVIFKIAFPNRICLFLANALFLVPALYPQYFSAVGRRFLLIGSESTVFVETNIPLILTLALTLITLVLSLVINRYERQKKMNMFLGWHPDEETADDEEDEEDTEESV